MGACGNKGEQEKLTEEEQEDHIRNERLPKTCVLCRLCSLFSCLYCAFFIV